MNPIVIIQPDERVLLICRRHWFILFLVFLKAAFALVVILGALFTLLFFEPSAVSGYQGLMVLGLVLASEILWIFLLLGITDYYLDTWLITDKRLVLIELKGIFNRTVTSLEFQNIQDITTRMVGFLPTFLNFGDVAIESSGTFGEFVFKQIPAPNDVKEMILKVRREYLGKTLQTPI